MCLRMAAIVGRSREQGSEMSRSWAAESLRDARPATFWSDRPDAPQPAPKLEGTLKADLTIIGGGFTGLWAAVQALEDEPGLRVVVVEAEQCGFGASSRNGGFCDSSLTHGLANGISHWPNEIETLVQFGRENLSGIETAINRYGIEADFRRAAEVGVATAEWQIELLAEELDAHGGLPDDIELLNATAMQARVHSPTYQGGLVRRSDFALLDPARLCWELRRTAETLGGLVFENSAVTSVTDEGSKLIVSSGGGAIESDRVLVATNAYTGPEKRSRRYVIPVYDHVLMTEPLNEDQMDSVGWEQRDGIADVSNQFHYYRLSQDNRILWGGYDATYHFGNGLGAVHDQSEGTHSMLADHFFSTFPQLEGLSFTHRWGGPIGTTSRFTAAWGSAHAGRLVWVGGYTGLGVGASRFGARVALDLVNGLETERTQLEMVRKRPIPFPPEPLRWAGVQMTRRAMQNADERGGKRGPWLALLDRFGVGFDS